MQCNGNRGRVGVVIQAYLYRSAADIDRLLAEGIRIRLCKGAYQEPANLAFPDKADVDSNFVRLMQSLLPSGVYHGIATHDEKMIDATRRFAKERGIQPDQFEFQMLYGVRRDLQRSLVAAGYRVRVYIPFGTDWYPYFMRRLAERPANLLFIARNFFRNNKENKVKTKNALKQAELILKLYEIRRETALRTARDYVGGEFKPKSVDEFVSLVKDGGKQSGHILQVYGYWDMVAAFVVHGALDESLIFDTCQEMYFQFEKIQPYLAGFREKMNLPEFLKSIESVVAGSQERRTRAWSQAKEGPFAGARAGGIHARHRAVSCPITGSDANRSRYLH